MHSRFLYLLLASAVFHVLVLGFPFDVTTGTPGIRTTRPVRVHLLTDGEESPAEASKEKGQKTRTKSPSVSAIGQKSRTEQKTQAHHRNQPATSTAKTAQQSNQSEQETHERASLRTTTVYPGLGNAQSSLTSVAPADKGAKLPATGTSVSANRRGSQPSQRGSFSQVRYARVVKPQYPEHARTKGWEGTTVLKVLVDRAGKSEEVRVHRTSGFNVLDDAAVNAMRRWEFHPARQGRKAVQSWVNVPIVFKLKEDQLMH